MRTYAPVRHRRNMLWDFLVDVAIGGSIGVSLGVLAWLATLWALAR